MDLRGCNNSIGRFLRMKGRSRLEVENEITEYFLALEFPIITFLESKRVETEYGEWEEIYILTQIEKEEAPDSLLSLNKQVGTIMKALKKLGVKECGIQELDCSDSIYNVLIYVLNNGKNKKENINCEEYN